MGRVSGQCPVLGEVTNDAFSPPSTFRIPKLFKIYVTSSGNEDGAANNLPDPALVDRFATTVI